MKNKEIIDSFFEGKKKPLIISGPCSAETREQTLETCRLLAATGKVDVLRAGIWKPRTRPGSFEGIGAEGLPWLQEVKKETGLPVTIEVAKAIHVEQALESGIDMLWIGARTTVNPFAVQEVADALKGVKIPVLVKNPINPDLALWLGAIERMQGAGLTQVGAIHRGFSNTSELVYRNRPQWQIPIEFKRRLPHIPLIGDPSHICGRRDLLQSVSQKSLDLDFDGLMIESHIRPDEAWSDAAQQLTPQALGEMIGELVIREDYQDNEPVQGDLNYLRQDINSIDEEILNLISNRMKVAQEIGLYKKKHNMTILQSKRWDAIVDKGKRMAKEFGLSEKFIVKYLRAIHDESIRQQESVMKEG